MSRSGAIVLAELLSLLPPGWVLPRDPDSTLGKVLTPHAREIARFEVAAEAMLEELDPRSAEILLPDFERVLGPDPCIDTPLALEDRQRSAHQRWTMRGGASIAWFQQLALTLGVEIEIEECRLAVAGEMQAGDETTVEGEQFAWIVHLPAVRVVDFYAGSEAGDLLGDFPPLFLECVIRRLAPAHTVPVFSYEEVA
ncbi:MAG: putative phage tail protein [Roseomonas mucosa]|nr:putative phage tail protein [Roseomonas mucosa]